MNNKQTTPSNESWEDTVKELLIDRDDDMYEYWKSVFMEGFKGGYPIEWNEKFLKAISKQISESYLKGREDMAGEGIEIILGNHSKASSDTPNPIETAERIVIEYANITGRDETMRAYVREAALKVLTAISEPSESLAEDPLEPLKRIADLAPFKDTEDCEKKAMINEVIKESSADQRLVMYKADLIREIDELYFTEDQGMDEQMASHNRTLDEVIQIIKKQ